MKNALFPITLAALVTAFTAQANGQNAEPDNLGMLDIKSQATERWFNLTGRYSDAAEVKTKRLKDGSLLLTDSPELIQSLTFDTFDRGQEGKTGRHYQLTVQTPAKATESGGTQIQSGSWNMVAQTCYSRYETTSGWIDACYKMHKLNSDGDGSNDYFQLEHYATAKSKFPFGLAAATIEAVKAGSSSSMEWVEWSPASDLDVGNCTSIGLEVAAQSVGISASHNICDNWDITKFSDAGHFKNKWSNVFTPISSERGVAYMIAVKVPQNGWPVWSLSKNFWTWLL